MAFRCAWRSLLATTDLPERKAFLYVDATFQSRELSVTSGLTYTNHETRNYDGDGPRTFLGSWCGDLYNDSEQHTHSGSGLGSDSSAYSQQLCYEADTSSSTFIECGWWLAGREERF
jgi:hypothetical protein